MQLRVKNAGEIVWVVPREDIGEPDLIIPAGQERESPPCKWLSRLIERGDLICLNVDKPQEANAPADLPQHLQPQWTKKNRCRALKAGTGEQCKNTAMADSDNCAAHQPK